MIQKICSSFVLVLCLIFVRLDAAAPAGPKTLKTWKAGLAKVVITPEKPIWMSGYASRNKPSEGKVHGRGLWIPPHTRRLDGVLHQHGNGQRPDTTGHRSDC